MLSHDIARKVWSNVIEYVQVAYKHGVRVFTRVSIYDLKCGVKLSDVPILRD